MGFPDQFPDLIVWRRGTGLIKHQYGPWHCWKHSSHHRHLLLLIVIWYFWWKGTLPWRQSNKCNEVHNFSAFIFCNLQCINVIAMGNNNNYSAMKRFLHYWRSVSKAPILCKSLQLFVHTGGMENKSLPAVFQGGHMMAPVIKVPWTEQSTNLSTLGKQAFKHTKQYKHTNLNAPSNMNSGLLGSSKKQDYKAHWVGSPSVQNLPSRIGYTAANPKVWSITMWPSLCINGRPFFWNPATGSGNHFLPGETNEKQTMIAGPRGPSLSAHLYLLCQFQCSTFTIVACNRRRWILILFSAARLVSP